MIDQTDVAKDDYANIWIVLKRVDYYRGGTSGKGDYTRYKR